LFTASALGWINEVFDPPTYVLRRRSHVQWGGIMSTGVGYRYALETVTEILAV